MTDELSVSAGLAAAAAGAAVPPSAAWLGAMGDAGTWPLLPGAIKPSARPRAATASAATSLAGCRGALRAATGAPRAIDTAPVMTVARLAAAAGPEPAGGALVAAAASRSACRTARLPAMSTSTAGMLLRPLAMLVAEERRSESCGAHA